MSTDIKDYIRHTVNIEWKELEEKGVDTSGIYIKIMRYDFQKERATSFLLKFDPGAHYPYHNHPAGEEIFVLEGACVIESETLYMGDYLYTPPGFKHSVTSPTGCIMLFVVPEEVEILE